MQFFLYILYSKKLDKYYIGHTNDFKQRLVFHNTSDSVSFTAKGRPWTIAAVFLIEGDRTLALKVEKELKSKKSRILIERIIAGEELLSEHCSPKRLDTF